MNTIRTMLFQANFFGIVLYTFIGCHFLTGSNVSISAAGAVEAVERHKIDLRIPEVPAIPTVVTSEGISTPVSVSKGAESGAALTRYARQALEKFDNALVYLQQIAAALMVIANNATGSGSYVDQQGLTGQPLETTVELRSAQPGLSSAGLSSVGLSSVELSSSNQSQNSLLGIAPMATADDLAAVSTSSKITGELSGQKENNETVAKQ